MNSYARTRKLCRIIEREFARIYEKEIRAPFVAAAIVEEHIYVIVNNFLYRMDIGSDDEVFDFFLVDGQGNLGLPPRVRFPIPDDYINIDGPPEPVHGAIR